MSTSRMFSPHPAVPVYLRLMTLGNASDEGPDSGTTRSSARTLEAIALRLEEMQMELNARLPVHSQVDDEPTAPPAV